MNGPLARWSFQALCFFYLMFINANIMVVRSAVRIVEFTLRCESCHLDRALNVEIGVEYRKIFIVLFFNVVVKCILGPFQDIEKVG